MQVRIVSAVALGLAALGLSFGIARANEFVLPHVDNSSFVASITEYAHAFDIDEVRGGPALSNLEMDVNHWLEPDLSSLNKGRLDSFQFDMFFKTPYPELLKWVGSPRPSVGGLVNLGGYESLIHAGLDWHVPIFDSPFYLEAGVGAGVHTGYNDHAPAGFHNTGCPALFHYEYGIGANLNQHVTATLEWQHMSSLFLCNPNQGLNHLGFVVGWKF
jgi:lipid A 3-O-deacylase